MFVCLFVVVVVVVVANCACVVDYVRLWHLTLSPPVSGGVFLHWSHSQWERERHVKRQSDDFTFNYLFSSLQRLNLLHNIYILFIFVVGLRFCVFVCKWTPVRCLSHLLLSHNNRIVYRFRCHLSCRIVIITFLYSQYPHIALTFGNMSGPWLTQSSGQHNWDAESCASWWIYT